MSWRSNGSACGPPYDLAGAQPLHHTRRAVSTQAISATDERPSVPDLGREALDFSVVIPAYNEEGAIGDEIDNLHSALSKLDLRYEVIVVDDGSRDATADVASTKDCTVLRQPQNRGYGAALKRGIAAARS